MGLAFYHSKSIVVEGLTVQRTGGDGVFLQDVNASRLSRLHLLDNFRQGLSIGAAADLLVEDCEFVDTGRGAAAAPACGVDVEPDNGGVLSNITFRRCISSNNTGCGIMVSSAAGVNAGSNVSVRFEDVQVDMRGQLNAVECKRQAGGCGGSCRAAWGFAKWSNVPGEVVLDRCTVVGAGINAPAVQLEIKGPASLMTFANCSFGMSTAAASPAIAFTPHYWPAPSAPDHLLYGGLRVEDTCVQADGALGTWLALVAPSGLANVHVDAVLVQEEEWSPSACAQAGVVVSVNGSWSEVAVDHSCATTCPHQLSDLALKASTAKLKSDDGGSVRGTAKSRRVVRGWVSYGQGLWPNCSHHEPNCDHGQGALGMIAKHADVVDGVFL